MKGDTGFFIQLAVAFLPFTLFAFLNSKANVKKAVRNRQYLMPMVAVIYSIVLLIFFNKISLILLNWFFKLAELFNKFHLGVIGDRIRYIHSSWGIYLTTVLFNVAAMILFVIVKKIFTIGMSKIHVEKGSFIGSLVEIFYTYEEQEEQWYIKEHYGQARTFVKTFYFMACILSGIALLVSFRLCMNQQIQSPFYPVFAIIIIGEIAFFIDGLEEDEKEGKFSLESDKSSHMVMYPLLRKPLKDLFGDKLSAEGTTVNNTVTIGGGVEDVLVGLERNGTHIGRNYAAFIRKKMAEGLKPNIDYLYSGYELAIGKSLLFNTPFYDKLNPYVFYAMNRVLLTGGKVMIVLGRHSTETDVYQWCENGMRQISNVPNMWKSSVLSNKKIEEDELPDIGIISRSNVHDLELHRNNMPFLKEVSFVMIVEPSRLVTTAQIGLNLLIKNCGQDRAITFCSVDRNCDGLVDALSHILMTNITEVSATEYPHGISSFMYWTADNEYLQHRILPGVSRYLGIGTELSLVALKNQVKRTVWYGGDAFPVKDAHWIAKQYYYELLDYAQLPTTQENFDNCFQISFNMCNERGNDYSYITVEDERCNLFEIRRNFATISEQQGFVNVISSEYMLREYMAANTDIFTADAKAIPYITADYARTKRNVILTLCLLLCTDSVLEKTIHRHMTLLNLETKELATGLWKEICVIFNEQGQTELDSNGNPVLSIKDDNGNAVRFERDEILLYKRAYFVESGRFESVYTIENKLFACIILGDLQNASYIAEEDNQDIYIGTELKGHVYQKYMPGQFLTLNGKYYEMVSTTMDNRIMVRRAAEHIGGRFTYRQVRNYTIHHLENSQAMGSLKSINNIDVYHQFADFTVETPGYWKLGMCNDFDNGDLIMVNGVPSRKYHHKQILKLDFSKLGEAFTDSVRITLTHLLNEVFVTLFAENQPFISAITLGNYDAPMTYSLALAEGIENVDKCIFIMEDSQLDIGLLIAVERNINRIFQIISDYLNWNDEQISESLQKENKLKTPKEHRPFDAYAEPEIKGKNKKKNFFGKIVDCFKRLLKKKSNSKKDEESNPENNFTQEEATPKQNKKAERAAKKAERKATRKIAKAQKKEAQIKKKRGQEAQKENTEQMPVVEETTSMSEAFQEQSEGEVSENA